MPFYARALSWKNLQRILFSRLEGTGDTRVEGGEAVGVAGISSDTVLSFAASAATATGTNYYPSAAGIDTRYYANLTLDATIAAGTGTITYTLQRLGADGTWYTVWTSGALNTAQVSGALSMEFGPSLPLDIPTVSATQPKRGSQSVVLKGYMRVREDIATAAVTRSYSFGGR